MLIAEVSGVVAGCCALAAARDPDLLEGFGEITALYVDETHRRHGHAERLVRAARIEASQRRSHSLALWVVESNRGARTFYERVGFIPDGTTRVDARLGFHAA